MTSPKRLTVITGASRGLGAQLARAFWAEGDSLILIARNGLALETVAGELWSAPTQPSQRALTMAADLASPEIAESVADFAHQNFGRIDCLICNAAVQGPIDPFRSVDFEDWRATLDVDLVAPIRLAHAALPHMTNKGGSIIFLSGGGAAGPRPSFSAYATAKAGLVRFAETLAHELLSQSVTVNCIAPGPMPTDMMLEIRNAGAEHAGRRETEAAAKVLDSPADAMSPATRLAVFLASEAARGITGRLISAVWDRYENWPAHLDDLSKSDAYTLRRIVGRDRGFDWGDR